MRNTAAALTLLAVFFCAGCRHPPSPPPVAKSVPVIAVAATELLSPSPRLIVGRIIAVDLDRGFATVELVRDAPLASIEPDTELRSRTKALENTAVLQASRYLRGRMLGTTIVTGRPTTGDEVVWLTP